MRLRPLHVACSEPTRRSVGLTVRRGPALIVALAALVVPMGIGRAAPAQHVTEDLTGHATADMTEVRLEPGQSLDDALAQVTGPVLVRLPAGVTEHTEPITREQTVVIRGAGREASTLRPAADVPLVHQGDLSEPFDGDLVLSDFTYDRAHRSVGDIEPSGVVVSNAGGEVIFRNFRIHRFDFAGRSTPVFRGLGPPVHRVRGAYDDDVPRHRYVGFHNAIFDFKHDGGIRNRHNSRTGSGTLVFNTDRFAFDADSVFQGHLTQHADPDQTVGDPPAGRGNAGGLGALAFNVWEHGLIDGTFAEVDYAIIRWGGVASYDGVLEIRCHAPDAGFADQFWTRAKLDGLNGHLIYDGVHLTSADGNPWHDRGLYARGSWKSVTVRNCIVSGRDAPIDFRNGLDERQGRITITDTVIHSRRRGIDIGSSDTVLEGVKISNVHIFPHEDSDAGFFTEAINLRERRGGEGTMHMIANVLADGYLNDIVTHDLSPDSTLVTENLHGRKTDRDSRVQDAYPLATIPRRALPLDGDAAVAEEIDPVATVEDFDNREEFSQLDVYLTDHTDGVYLMVIVGADSLSNTQDEPRSTWRGDAIQFAITHGLPGDNAGYVLFDLARHDERGLHVYRRNFWPEQDLAEGELDLAETDIELAVTFDEDAGHVVYQAFFPWEEIGLPAPWYDHLSIDLAATRGETYPQISGTTWPSPYEDLGEGEEAGRARGGGIFHAPTVPTRGFKAVECQ